LKKTALIILLLFSANVTIYAETIVKGGIEKNESWIPKLSPYIIENTITVEKNGFLTIYPGTEVKARNWL
jgi:hypothetical protein